MRYVTLTKLGTPACEGTEVTIPYNGDIFEFLDPEWRGLARRAAASERGRIREGLWVAEIIRKDGEITQAAPELLAALRTIAANGSSVQLDPQWAVRVARDAIANLRGIQIPESR